MVGVAEDALEGVAKGESGARIRSLLKSAIEEEGIDHPVVLSRYALLLTAPILAPAEDVAQAEQLLTRALQLDPGHVPSLLRLATLLSNVRKQHGDAMSLLQRAIEADPSDKFEPLSHLAQLRSNAFNDKSGAELLYRQALSRHTSPPLATVRRFCDFLQRRLAKGDLDECDSLFSWAVQAYPQNAPLFCEYAWMLHNCQGQQEKAQALLARAAAANPLHPGVLAAQGALMESYEGHKPESGALFLRALQLDPAHPTALGHYAIYLHQHLNDPSAEVFYRRALAVRPQDADLLCGLGTFLEQNRADAREARTLLEKAVSVSPHDADAITHLAALLQERYQEHEAARELLQRGLQCEPENPTILTRYGRLAEDVDANYEVAEVHYRRALEIDPRNVFALCSLAGIVSDSHGNAPAAAQLYDRALEAEPTHAASLCNYATLLHDALHRPGAAKDMYERALAAQPDHPAALCNYAGLKRDVFHDLAGAEVLYKRAAASDPSDSLALLHLGHLLRDRGDARAAERYFKRAVELEPTNVNSLLSYGQQVALGRSDMQTAESLLAMAAKLAPSDAEARQGLEWVRAACAAAGGSVPRSTPITGAAAAIARKEMVRRRGLRAAAIPRKGLNHAVGEVSALVQAGTEAERMAALLLEEDESAQKSPPKPRSQNPNLRRKLGGDDCVNESAKATKPKPKPKKKARG
ncbi:hypothetical protein T484DRAFT_2940710 [Baffinella frigidus]|nr:hypothetical protein T484DRAFT_2940710 [Cryptophyta sp. CCMP2293]